MSYAKYLKITSV